MPCENLIVFCGLIRAISLALVSRLKPGCGRNSAILINTVWGVSLPFDVSCSPSNSPSMETERPRAQCAAESAWVFETRTIQNFVVLVCHQKFVKLTYCGTAENPSLFCVNNTCHSGILVYLSFRSTDWNKQPLSVSRVS